MNNRSVGDSKLSLFTRTNKPNIDRAEFPASVPANEKRDTSPQKTVKIPSKRSRKAAVQAQDDCQPRLPTHEQIAERARSIWLSEGQPNGRDEEFWLRAETEIKKEGHLLSQRFWE